MLENCLFPLGLLSECLQAHRFQDRGLVWKGLPQGGREDPDWGSVGGRAASPSAVRSTALRTQSAYVPSSIGADARPTRKSLSPSHRPGPKPREGTSAWRTGQGGCGPGRLRLPPSVTQEPPRLRNSTKRCFVFFKATSLGKKQTNHLLAHGRRKMQGSAGKTRVKRPPSKGQNCAAWETRREPLGPGGHTDRSRKACN